MQLWNGFHVQWQYNHRANRLGSYVENDEAKASAASGTGPDTARIDTYLTSTSLAAKVGSTELRATGAEGDTIVARSTVFVPASFAQATPVLQGFDTFANDSADKLRHFSVQLSDARAVPGGFAIDVEARWSAACTSAECKADGTIDQTVRVYWALLEGAGSHIETKVRGAWNEQERTPPLHAALAPPRPGEISLLRGFSLDLSDEMHLLSFGVQVDADGVDFDFQNWRNGMKLAHVPASLFSYRQAGEATMTASVVRLSAPDAKAHTATADAHWRGCGRPADGTK